MTLPWGSSGDRRTGGRRGGAAGGEEQRSGLGQRKETGASVSRLGRALVRGKEKARGSLGISDNINLITWISC